MRKLPVESKRAQQLQQIQSYPANAALKSDDLNSPQRSGPEAREGRPRGQFRRSRLPCAKGRVCGEHAGAQRIHGRCSLAERHPAHGECRRRGVAGTPARMGSGNRSVFRVGKVISPTEGRFRILDFLQARSARPAFREARAALARHPPSAGKKSGSFQTRIRGRIAHPAGVDF